MTRTESKLLSLLTCVKEKTQVDALYNIQTGERININEEIAFLIYKDGVEAHLRDICTKITDQTGTNYTFKEVEGVYVFGPEARLLDLELQKPLTWKSV